MEKLKIKNYEIHVYQTVKNYDAPVLYTHFARDVADQVMEQCPGTAFTLVSIAGIDWNRDLSPWKAGRAFKGSEDFAGGAGAYLEVLTKELIPAIEEFFGLRPRKRGIIGYSLAGLFAVYALYKADLFQLAGSVSGSLWFDGFVEFMQSHELRSPVERIYFSLGDQEKETKNQRIAQVEKTTVMAEQYLRNLGFRTIYEKNPGKHFEKVPERIARGIRWLVR